MAKSIEIISPIDYEDYLKIHDPINPFKLYDSVEEANSVYRKLLKQFLIEKLTELFQKGYEIVSADYKQIFIVLLKTE